MTVDDCGRGCGSQALEAQWGTNHTSDLQRARAPDGKERTWSGF